ncbi:carboxypeptidase-like regulatory domain-containing protein, partial [Microvirga sp. 3-52]|nr:carboxypeptidase-like regulatory domain-containing protein [Microvirga sp. 3-52]
FGYGLIDAYGAVSAVTEGVGTVEGTIKTNEIPLNAHVSIEGRDRSVNTNPNDGTYALKYAGGDYTLIAEAYGYETKEAPVTIERDETTTVDFTLDAIPQATISGKLTDKSTGAPIENATLLLKEDANIAPVKTDAKGHYEFTAYEGTYTVKITARGFKSQEVEITIDGDQTINHQLTPFYSYAEEEIAYDDGTGEGASRFKDAGHGWGVKMSLAPGEEKAMVTGGKFLINVRTSDHFQVEVMDASGPGGSPGKKIAGPIDAKASATGWTTVDLRDEGIIVDGDFYMVYIQTEDSTTSTSLQQDKSSPFQSRSWEMYSGYWYQLESSFLVGNKSIRALVEYELDQPIITSPKSEDVTNNEAM